MTENKEPSVAERRSINARSQASATPAEGPSRRKFTHERLGRPALPRRHEPLRAWLQEAADDLRGLRDQAQAAGAIHHRFGAEEGSAVVAIDEWQSAEAYQRFVQEANIQRVAQQAGASGPPDVKIYEAVSSPDEL